MDMKNLFLLPFLILIISSHQIAAQFYTVGAAEETDRHYRLTHSALNVTGAIWNQRLLNLYEPFDIYCELFFGCEDNGGEGIAFVLQNKSSDAIGTDDLGLGYLGLTPSLAIEFDNAYSEADEFEVPYDHISIVHNQLSNYHPIHVAGPVMTNYRTINVEDCEHHKTRISWDPSINLLSIYVDGQKRLNHTIDIANDIFQGSQQVFWGFTAATGCITNSQGVKVFSKPPAPLMFEVKTTPASCNKGGSARISMIDAKAYTCKWSNGSNTPRITDLVPGNYSITVVNEWGERIIEKFVIEEATNEPLRLAFKDNNLPSAEENAVEVSGGQAPFTFNKGVAFVVGDDAFFNINADILEVRDGELIELAIGKRLNEVRDSLIAQNVLVQELNYLEVTDHNDCTAKKYVPVEIPISEMPEVELIKERIEADPTTVLTIANAELPIPQQSKEELPNRSSTLTTDLPEPKLEMIEIKEDPNKPPTVLENRIVAKGRKVTVHSNQLRIAVWDAEDIDGDIISLYYNGEWILREYTLKRKKKKIKINLKPNSDNYLVFYAHNEGSKPPNTASMIIFDGSFRKQMAIRSTMEHCGAINFKTK